MAPKARKLRYSHDEVGRNSKRFIYPGIILADILVTVTLLLKRLPRQCCFLLGLGVILFGTRLFALDPSRTLFQYNFQSWTRQNGLPFNRIRAIAQSPDG